MYNVKIKGIITIELLLAFFLWAIFLTGILGLWFTLFGPNIPMFQYIDQENFFVKQEGVISYLDRGIKIVKNSGLVALVTDWKNDFGRKTCRGLDAKKLISIPIEPFVLDGQNVATAMFVRGSRIFLTANSASTTDPDFYSISITIKENPTVESKIHTGPGLSSISVLGYMAFVSNTSVNSQAQAIDISNEPQLVWSFKVPGSQGTSTALGKVIVSDGNVVYLGTAKNHGEELYAISASTGVRLNSYELSSGVNGLFLNNSKLYVSSPVDPELLVFDTALKSIGQYDATGGSGNGKSIEVVNEDIYLGRTLGGNELIKLTDKLTKVVDVKIGATVDAMIASKNQLYVLTGHSQKELQVWNTEGGLTLNQTVDLPARAVALGCSGEYLYVALNTHEPLMIFKAYE